MGLDQRHHPKQRYNSLQSVTKGHRFMGLVIQLGYFSSWIAEISQPVRELHHSNHAWVWGPDQQRAIQACAGKTNSACTLQPWDQITVSADASSYWLGAILLQLNGKIGSQWPTSQGLYQIRRKGMQRRLWQPPGHARSSVIAFSDVPFSDHKPLSWSPYSTPNI